MDIREAIKKEMKRQRVTQAWVCEETGIDQGHLSNFLKCEKEFGRENLEQIFAVLGLELKRR